jgi:hypothetical protein
MDDTATIKAILKNVDDMLDTATLGLSDMVEPQRKRRLSGLRNVLSFGRAVTFVLQNLRGKASGFDDWYEPLQTEMRADPLMRYMVHARNELEKQGKLSITNLTRIGTNGGVNIGELLASFGKPPPNATGAQFIGDQLGGSGWIVRMPDGSEGKYYVGLNFPGVESKLIFTNLADAKSSELNDVDIDQLCAQYLDKLKVIVSTAHDRFASTA